MKKPSETAETQLIEICNLLTEHVKLMRDYATTPGNEWLARSEVSQIQELMAQVEELLAKIKQANEQTE
jgi:hypothetical protein